MQLANSKVTNAEKKPFSLLTSIIIPVTVITIALITTQTQLIKAENLAPWTHSLKDLTLNFDVVWVVWNEIKAQPWQIKWKN